MEKLFRSPKANRILYASVVAALCILAVIIGIVAAANRPEGQNSGTNTPPPADNTPTPTPDQPTGADGENDPEEIVYLCPISGTVSQKHDTETLVFSSTMGDWRIHTGLDISAALGDTVYAAAPGTVKEVWDDAMMGKCVSIAHEGDVVTIYKNLGESLPTGLIKGTQVKAGDAIGTVGETALSEMADEPHLHFEMTVKGAPVDPLSYLSKESIETSLQPTDTVYEE